MGIKPNPRRALFREELWDLRVKLSLMEDRGATQDDIEQCREELARLNASLSKIENEEMEDHSTSPSLFAAQPTRRR